MSHEVLRLSDKDVNELRGLAERLTKGHESLAAAWWRLAAFSFFFKVREDDWT